MLHTAGAPCLRCDDRRHTCHELSPSSESATTVGVCSFVPRRSHTEQHRRASFCRRFIKGSALVRGVHWGAAMSEHAFSFLLGAMAVATFHCWLRPLRRLPAFDARCYDRTRR
jgi:hypothetical protein